MTAFAKLTLTMPALSGIALFDAPTESQLALTQRNELSEKSEVNLQPVSPATLKTLVNALTLMYLGRNVQRHCTGPRNGALSHVLQFFLPRRA